MVVGLVVVRASGDVGSLAGNRKSVAICKPYRWCRLSRPYSRRCCRFLGVVVLTEERAAVRIKSDVPGGGSHNTRQVSELLKSRHSLGVGRKFTEASFGITRTAPFGHGSETQRADTEPRPEGAECGLM